MLSHSSHTVFKLVVIQNSSTLRSRIRVSYCSSVGRKFLSKEAAAVSPQVRNLTYMVTRREKMKRSLWRVQENIFQHQMKLLDHELLTGESAIPEIFY